ncbi:hypothetical protein ABH933_008782 [Nocardia sp. GP40]
MRFQFQGGVSASSTRQESETDENGRADILPGNRSRIVNGYQRATKLLGNHPAQQKNHHHHSGKETSAMPTITSLSPTSALDRG